LVAAAACLAAALGVSALLATAGLASPANSSGAIIATYRGNGDTKLPPFRLSKGATLIWTNDGSTFAIHDDAQHEFVTDSQAHRGSTYLAVGLHQFSIIALGNWTITVKRSSAPGSGRFSGNGDKKLPPFKTGPRGATVTWTNSGSTFALHDDAQHEFVVDSEAHRGTSYLGPGLHQFSVIALGSWTVTIKSR
jgi:hypothetical protein